MAVKVIYDSKHEKILSYVEIDARTLTVADIFSCLLKLKYK